MTEIDINTAYELAAQALNSSSDSLNVSECEPGWMFSIKETSSQMGGAVAVVNAKTAEVTTHPPVSPEEIFPNNESEGLETGLPTHTSNLKLGPRSLFFKQDNANGQLA